MVRRAKKFYSEEFKNRALAAYHNSNESVLATAECFVVKHDTFKSWVYRKQNSSASEKTDKLARLNSTGMKKEKMSPEALLAHICDLERELSIEKMRSESLSKMIEIAERELQIDIRKKTGAKQSLR